MHVISNVYLCIICLMTFSLNIPTWSFPIPLLFVIHHVTALGVSGNYELVHYGLVPLTLTPDYVHTYNFINFSV